MIIMRTKLKILLRVHNEIGLERIGVDEETGITAHLECPW